MPTTPVLQGIGWHWGDPNYISESLNLADDREVRSFRLRMPGNVAAHHALYLYLSLYFYIFFVPLKNRKWETIVKSNFYQTFCCKCIGKCNYFQNVVSNPRYGYLKFTYFNIKFHEKVKPG